MNTLLQYIRPILICFGLCTQLAFAQSAPFVLSDTGPNSPSYKDRFMANYGVHSEIEPPMAATDRPLYEKVFPLIKTNPRAAIAELNRSMSSNSNPAFFFLLGSLQYQTGQLSQSEQSLSKAIDKFPDFRRAHRTLGLLYAQQSRHDAALRTWLKVISLGGGDAQSYGLLGYTYLSQEKYHSALKAYEMARMFQPDSIDFQRGEAQCLLKTGQADRASTLVEELIKAHPTSSDYWRLQANCLLQLGNHDDAILHLEIANDLGAANAQSHFLLGDLYLRTENSRLAQQHYLAALETPNQPSLTSALRPLEYLIARGLIEEADAYLQLLESTITIKSDKEREQIALSKADIRMQQGQADQALDLLKQIVERNPINGEALLLIAEIAQANEDLIEAEFQLQRARALPDTQVDALIQLGRLEVDRNDFKAALDYLYSAQSLKPSVRISRYIDAIKAAM
ncbi:MULTISPECIES: tetratricopeptide repeat protein [unclassified Lentimonas]|uniref:tetratricopeptide repeat protein n=1 Tax=unclassified Lentimonas TaxID=2630993 RepID=UPI001325FF6A|nr:MULTISPECIES: tetratricopeptide repeat protein [unclassified Lentimonas]CAA6695438.1 Unannotated [Lentimonas sp. CC10]CAA6696611.1 Unannotated [Lentimonas sp. CC19]CAA7071309.1 Unannotated [Lentimonas sp. CC11]